MSNKSNSKRFIKLVGVLVGVMVVITAYLGYLLDPNMYYRLAENEVYYSEAYTTSGTIKNYPAKIAVIGSSMIQNTDMDLIRQLFNEEPIKYTRSGMNIDEISMLINRAIDTKNEVDKFIVNIDMTMFNTDKYEPYEKFPKYLYNDNKIDDIKYLLGFETWTKFIPFNLVYNMALNIDTPITNKITSTFSSVVDLDNMGDWSNGTLFGEDIVKSKYSNNLETVSKQNTEDMLERMKLKFDKDFYPTFENNTEKEFMIVLPPYSALMWYEAEKQGYIDKLYDFKTYIVDKFDNLENVTIYDFQDYEGIIDLNNYKDTTHYIPEFNDMIINNIYENKNIINSENIELRIDNLKNLLDNFKNRYKNWL